MKNITVDPLSSAKSVDAPVLDEVLDLDSGEFLGTKAFIENMRYGEIIPKRVEAAERIKSNPRFVCAICMTPAYLVCSPDKKFFFRHAIDPESCKKTRGSLNQAEILARKYHGLRESKAHKDLKRLIEESLLADCNFRNIAVESYWRPKVGNVFGRRPDVQALHPWQNRL